MAHIKSIFGRKTAPQDARAASPGSSDSGSPFSEVQAPAPAAVGPLRSPSAVSVTGVSRQGSVGASAGSVFGLSRSNASTTSLSRQTSRNGHKEPLPRFEELEGGSHVHHLRNARRQEKLTRMLWDIMGPNHGGNAVSAIPAFVEQNEQLSLMTGLVNKVQAGQIEVGNVNGASVAQKKGQPNYGGPKQIQNAKEALSEASGQSLTQKYGKCQEVIGKGSYGVVRVSHKFDSAQGREVLYAVKEFRKREVESEQTFQDRLTSEFCIASSLKHHNIISTLDLMKNAQGGCFEVMEYCSGGDLYTLILSSGKGLFPAEADCFFKQILRGVTYMHSMGIAHCDLKPENILLTPDGVCKISDFGNGECFRMAWETSIHLSNGIYGSGPYIAPEEFKHKPFDPRAVDIWATGVIYMVMRTGSYLWRTAEPDEDDFFKQYLGDRKTSDGYAPIEALAPSKSVYVIYSILDPVPSRRITGKQVLNSEWGRSIRVCEAGDVRHGDHDSARSSRAASPMEKTQTQTQTEPQRPPQAAIAKPVRS